MTIGNSGGLYNALDEQRISEAEQRGYERGKRETEERLGNPRAIALVAEALKAAKREASLSMRERAAEVARSCGSDKCPTPCNQLGHVVRCPHYIAAIIEALKVGE